MIENEKRARNIVAQYHGGKAAKDAEAEEKKVHAGEALPEDMPEISVSESSLVVTDLLVKCGLFPSKGEAKRMVKNGGVSVDDKKISDPMMKAQIRDGIIIRVGKRKFVKVLRG